MQPVGFNTGSHMSVLGLLKADMCNLILDVNGKLGHCIVLLTACNKLL